MRMLQEGSFGSIGSRRVRGLTSVFVSFAACLAMAGCAARVYGPPPPPGAYAGNPLVQEAERRGFRSGADDGTRDAVSATGYHPRRDRKYAETPGYDPAFGPYPPYRDAFRSAYLRGYADGFNRR